MAHALLFIAGWGMRDIIWSEMEHRLTNYQVIYPKEGIFQQDDWIEKLHDQIGREVVCSINIIGWSMGSMLAIMYAAAYPMQVERLILIGSTSRFVLDESNQTGQSPIVLSRMKRRLSSDLTSTMMDFYDSMFTDLEKQTEMYANFNRMSCTWKMHSLQTLMNGLDFLMQADLRQTLPTLNMPVYLIHGMNDPICNVEAAIKMHSMLPQSQLILLKEAGHMPFGFQGEEFITIMKRCLLHD